MPFGLDCHELGTGVLEAQWNEYQAMLQMCIQMCKTVKFVVSKRLTQKEFAWLWPRSLGFLSDMQLNHMDQ